MIRSEYIQQVIGKAIVDEQFRNILLNNTREAIKDIPLTELEIALIVSVKAETFEQFSAHVDALLINFAFLPSGSQTPTHKPAQTVPDWITPSVNDCRDWTTEDIIRKPGKAQGR